MKSLNTLIKLHKKNLDQIAAKKKKAEEELDYIVRMRDMLVEESKKEIEKYHTSEYAYMLDNYLKEFRAKKEELDGSINIYKQHIARLEDDLRNEFSELKKFEIAKKNRLAAEAAKELKKETEQLDEFTTGKFVRKAKK